MNRSCQRGQTNLTMILVLVGLIVAGVWIWKRLPPDTQDDIVDRAIPIAAVSLAVSGSIALVLRKIRNRRRWQERRERLMMKFEREGAIDKKRELAFTLIEFNEYRMNGLERVAPAMAELFMTTMKTALGDKQHRIRGMAASHLGVLEVKSAVPLLLAALEDEHAYVRSCAALALGRMRAVEAKAKLQHIIEEDWDQTVRGRAREAVERMG